MISRILLALLALALPLAAQDGMQLYSLYCSACHGADGQGATGGAFPPLAESPWVKDAPDRAVKIVLKGIHGPVEVLGKTYNLEMPPQGAALPDDQIAAILTHIRTSWGNDASPVTAEFVKATRAATDSRKTAWTSEELLKLHPLPLQKTALSDLTSQVYSGKWTSIPDFTKLKAENIEEEHDGIITTDDSPRRDFFGMVWEAKFEVPATGDYAFLLDADDAAKVIIDGQLIVEVAGNGPRDGSRAQKATHKLAQGPHKMRVEYLENNGQEGISLGWMPSNSKTWNWLTDEKERQKRAVPLIPIEPLADRPVIYRNFIAGIKPRAIGVGFPGGLNLAYSADDLFPQLIWTGKFIEGSHKWLERGTANSPPAGEDIVSFGNSRTLPENAKFAGYKLDPAGNPTFVVQIGKQTLSDSWHAETQTLVRKLTLIGNGGPISISTGRNSKNSNSISVEQSGDNNAPSQAGELISLSPGKSITLSYRWK
jgi:mono/diheme cytochrome c family protein